MQVTDGSVSGKGFDALGEARWTGEIRQAGTSTVTKSYTGKHSVVHSVTYKPETHELIGVWNVQGKTGPGTNGAVKITEVVSERRMAAASKDPESVIAATNNGNQLAFPSIERAEMGKEKALPALTQVKGGRVSGIMIGV